MVLQAMSPAIRGIAPKRKCDDTWLSDNKLFNKKDGEQAVRSWRRRSEVPIEAMDG
jgi:hypothetical protein